MRVRSERAHLVAGARPAVACAGQRFTHAELHERVRRLVGALRAMDLGEGARVAVVGPNCHRYLELYLAVPAGGFVLVPLNARHTERELRYAIEDSGATLLFATAEYRALEGCVERLIELPGGYDSMLAASAAGSWGSIREDCLAGLFYTGGTTGAAKGVMLTHGNLVANALHFMACWPFTPQTRWLVCSPMFHAAGTIGVPATVWAGGCHVILPGSIRAPCSTRSSERGYGDAGRADDDGCAGRRAGAETARRLLPAVAQSRQLASGHIRPAAHCRRLSERLPTAHLRPYGDGANPDAPSRRATAARQSAGALVGRPAIGIELKIVENAGGRRLPPAEIGEVQARGANVTAGYWNKREATERALAGGWLSTGDLGYLDETGHLFLVDRAKDMIVSGGENVYCTEVEEALYSHPAVREAAVFEIPDERWGEAVHAVVVPRSEISEAKLLLHCRRLIAAYKVPKQIELTSEPLPSLERERSSSGKLREPFWEGHETRVG